MFSILYIYFQRNPDSIHLLHIFTFKKNMKVFTVLVDGAQMRKVYTALGVLLRDYPGLKGYVVYRTIKAGGIFAGIEGAGKIIVITECELQRIKRKGHPGGGINN